MPEVSKQIELAPTAEGQVGVAGLQAAVSLVNPAREAASRANSMRARVAAIGRGRVGGVLLADPREWRKNLENLADPT